MAGRVIIEAEHRCDYPGPAPGVVWQCDDCGGVWRSNGHVWTWVFAWGRWRLRRKGLL